MSHQMNRRQILERAAFLSAACASPGLIAEELMRTAHQGEGPFYPDKLPLDTDNDLLILNDSMTPAVGQVTHLTGTVQDIHGRPVRNAVVEIWQVDNGGCYLHSGSGNKDKQDANFQGFGRFLTSRKGEYYFRTIKPVDYPGRVPHIHVAVNIKGDRVLTTQCYVKGNPRNEQDRLFQSVKDPRARDTILVDFKPIPDSRVGACAARFDIVLGVTPEDAKPS